MVNNNNSNNKTHTVPPKLGPGRWPYILMRTHMHTMERLGEGGMNDKRERESCQLDCDGW